ncbi:5'-nucleotidase SurE-like [Salvia splendens]|uniref:5'-nucleotidase SurE-like n=1 Tax=Salvia splendens TaxID=180675 RepID=UPI001C2536F4|nr:5'-nucleotidase SurE-like [Salvia splendens]
MTTPALNNNFLPPGLVSNLQQALANRKPDEDDAVSSKADDDSARPFSSEGDDDSSKPVIFLTNSDGIESPGLSFLLDALVTEGAYSVNVIAPQSDKTTSAHSVSLKETIEVAPVEVKGATAYEISGTPVDCVSLALSGALFSWTKPLLVISGINKGSSCGHHMFYSSVVAGAREALVCGVPSISISLNWQDESQESDFKDAVAVCLPIIKAAMRDIEKGFFPKGFSLDLELPRAPSANKGIKVTKRSQWRSNLNWQAVSNTRAQATARFAGGQPPMGLNIAQLSRDASAAGAARRLTTQKKDIEVVESVGASEKSDFKRTVKYFRAEMLHKDNKEDGEDLDFRAVENGFVSLTPLYASADSETDAAALNWISSAVLAGQ